MLIPSIAQVLIASPEFQAATIQNIDRRFGATSASHTFYQKVFELYNSAPGASSANAGQFRAWGLWVALDHRLYLCSLPASRA